MAAWTPAARRLALAALLLLCAAPACLAQDDPDEPYVPGQLPGMDLPGTNPTAAKRRKWTSLQLLHWEWDAGVIPPRADHPMHGHFWVPMDDESCMAWSFDYHPVRALSELEREAMEAGKGVHVRVDRNFRPLQNKDNDYLIDRAAQKAGKTFSGVEGRRDATRCTRRCARWRWCSRRAPRSMKARAKRSRRAPASRRPRSRKDAHWRKSWRP